MNLNLQVMTNNLFIFFLVLIISGCNQFPKISPVNIPTNTPTSQTQTQNSSSSAKDFDTVPSNTPCWLHNPRDCEEFEQLSDKLIPVYIKRSHEEGDLSEKQKEKINSKIYNNYKILLTKEIEKEIKESLQGCQDEKRTKCQDFLSEFFMKSEPLDIRHQFEFIKNYPSTPLRQDTPYEYYVLGFLSEHKHQVLKQKIIDYIQNKVPPAYTPVRDPKIKWLE